ncbi:sulfate adenylyltransferase subunit 1 [Tianweitania sediminis]|uniref:Bifunctional enzyme NodQ n=1 Tax=Tianweitania sediminis TaxID=1502156 RepID=A0A8J7UM52_9HYPH|nr:GTP-binding protein [Tianweitania sediminis]MBP0441449.1 50S ribosome-binding GTPase [Tianweitania sediminis]
MPASQILPFEPVSAVEQPSRSVLPDTLRLRFLVCGSVDDGKSTLIGRLLWDTKSVAEDHRATLLARGSRQNDLDLPDFALLLDGLKAEQEQGITIDVAYRYFQTPRRAFIVADTPGHTQYTRNMATGASTANVAVLLIDARAGLLEQTRRHATICHLMGIRQMILAINKIDLVNYSQAVFERIVAEFRAFSSDLAGIALTAVPVSALKGENVVASAKGAMGWYRGPTLLEALEGAEERDQSSLPFRMSVQRVSRPSEGFRGYQGTIAAGEVTVGDRITVHPSGETVSVLRIVTFNGDLEEASAGEAVTLVLDRATDAARGDILAAADAPPMRARAFRAKVIALQGGGLMNNSRILVKSGARLRSARITVQSALDLATGAWQQAATLPLNSIGEVVLQFDEETLFDRFEDCSGLGAFVLIDPQTNNTIAGGMVIDLAQPDAATSTRMTVSMPSGLVERIFAIPELAEYRKEIEVLARC